MEESLSEFPDDYEEEDEEHHHELKALKVASCVASPIGCCSCFWFVIAAMVGFGFYVFKFPVCLNFNFSDFKVINSEISNEVYQRQLSSAMSYKSLPSVDRRRRILSLEDELSQADSERDRERRQLQTEVFGITMWDSKDFYYRAISSVYLNVFYYSQKTNNILTKDLLGLCHAIEKGIKDFEGYHYHSLIYKETAQEIKDLLGVSPLYLEAAPGSFLNYVYPEVIQGNYVFNGNGDKLTLIGDDIEETIRTYQDVGDLTEFFDFSFNFVNVSSKYLAAVYPFGYSNSSETRSELTDFVASYKPKFFDKLGNVVTNEIGIAVSDSKGVILETELYFYLGQDLQLAIWSLFVIYVVVYLYCRSLYITTLGLVGVLSAFVPCFAFYQIVWGESFNLVNMVALWVILGIGCDDICVFISSYRRAPLETVDGMIIPNHLRLAFAYREGGSAMFVTSFTTSCSFFSLCLSSINPLPQFGFFLGSLVLANFVLVMTWFPCILQSYIWWVMCSMKCGCFIKKCSKWLSVPVPLPSKYDLNKQRSLSKTKSVKVLKRSSIKKEGKGDALMSGGHSPIYGHNSSHMFAGADDIAAAAHADPNIATPSKLVKSLSRRFDAQNKGKSTDNGDFGDCTNLYFIVMQRGLGVTLLVMVFVLTSIFAYTATLITLPQETARLLPDETNWGAINTAVAQMDIDASQYSGYSTSSGDSTGAVAIVKTSSPTESPILPTTAMPTRQPTDPTNSPTTPSPSSSPTTAQPTTGAPTPAPYSVGPTHNPTTLTPTTTAPSDHPSLAPTNEPTKSPLNEPTSSPSSQPSNPPSTTPTAQPSTTPTDITLGPSVSPTSRPSDAPLEPADPTSAPTVPSPAPSAAPTQHSETPTTTPSKVPSLSPSESPSQTPTQPSAAPSHIPSSAPVTSAPSQSPSRHPSEVPITPPTASPSVTPSRDPTNTPSKSPTKHPSMNPSQTPTTAPTTPSAHPSTAPTPDPTQIPTHALPGSPSFFCFNEDSVKPEVATGGTLNCKIGTTDEDGVWISETLLDENLQETKLDGSEIAFVFEGGGLKGNDSIYGCNLRNEDSHRYDPGTYISLGEHDVVWCFDVNSVDPSSAVVKMLDMEFTVPYIIPSPAWMRVSLWLYYNDTWNQIRNKDGDEWYNYSYVEGYQLTAQALSVDETIPIYLLFGTEDVSEFTTDCEGEVTSGELTFDNRFNIYSFEAQQRWLDLCDALDTIQDEIMYRRDEDQELCFARLFDGYLNDSSRDQPLPWSNNNQNKTLFNDYVVSFVKTKNANTFSSISYDPRTFNDWFGTTVVAPWFAHNASIGWVYQIVRTQIGRKWGGAAMYEYYKKWDSFMADFNAGSPSSFKGIQSSSYYIRMEVEVAFLEGFVQSVAITIILCAIVMIFFTQNLYLVALVCVYILIICIWVVGLFGALEWPFGIIEIISVPTVVGLTIDYALHITHAYIHSPFPDRLRRTKSAINDLGSSVFASAMTTVSAMMILYFATIVIFSDLGWVVGSTTSFGVVLALFVCPPCLMYTGPEYDQCHFTWCCPASMNGIKVGQHTFCSNEWHGKKKQKHFKKKVVKQIELEQQMDEPDVGDAHGGAEGTNAPVNATNATDFDDLPDGWKAVLTDDGKLYYQNDITHKTQWTRPAVSPSAPNDPPAVVDPEHADAAAARPETSGAQPVQAAHDIDSEKEQARNEPIFTPVQPRETDDGQDNAATPLVTTEPTEMEEDKAAAADSGGDDDELYQKILQERANIMEQLGSAENDTENNKEEVIASVSNDEADANQALLEEAWVIPQEDDVEHTEPQQQDNNENNNATDDVELEVELEISVSLDYDPEQADYT
eukprot:27380_1